MNQSHPIRRLALAILAVGLTVGGLTAVQPRESAAPAPGSPERISSVDASS